MSWMRSNTEKGSVPQYSTKQAVVSRYWVRGRCTTEATHLILSFLYRLICFVHYKCWNISFYLSIGSLITYELPTIKTVFCLLEGIGMPSSVVLQKVFYGMDLNMSLERRTCQKNNHGNHGPYPGLMKCIWKDTLLKKNPRMEMSYECFSSSDQRAKMMSNMLSGNPYSRVKVSFYWIA